MPSSAVRPLAGLATIVVLAGIVFFAIGMFRGGFGTTIPVTVVSERAGLVMNPEAKVKMRGVQVGQVDSIETRPDGKAVLHLAMDPKQIADIPGNVNVDITSSTVFGAKFVELVAPDDPSATPLAKGQQLDAQHVTVEINTVFQQLTSVLHAIDPVKLNQTLAAFSGALNGRGEKLGQTVTDFKNLLVKLNPSLDNISRDIEVAPVALNAYADAAPDLVDILDNTVKVSNTLVDQEKNLDTFLVSAIGLADTGNDVVGTNRQALTDLLHMLAPTTALLSQYNENVSLRTQGLEPVHPRLAAAAPRRHDVVELHPGCRALPLPGGPAKGGRQERPVLQGSDAARRAGRKVPAVLGRRRRRQPVEVRKPGDPGQLGRAQAGVVRAHLRSATQQRADRNAGMTRGAGTFIKFGIFAVIMALLTVFLFFTFGQYRTGSTNGYSAVFTDASRLAKGDTVRVAGIRVGTVTDVSLNSDRKVLVEFDADRNIRLTDGTKAAIRYLNLTGDRFLDLVDGARLHEIDAAGSPDPGRPDRTGARPGSAPQRPQARHSGAQSPGRQRAHLVAGAGVPGPGRHH